MIAYTTFLLFLLALLCLVPVGAERNKMALPAFFAAFLAVCSYFFVHAGGNSEHILSFVWNSSVSGDIKIDIVSSAYTYLLTTPFVFMTLIACAGNLFFRYEEKQCQYMGVLLFNLTAAVAMITSNNFVQLLSALFMADIFSLFLIKNTQALRRFAMLNIAADMTIFTILAMINCHVDSLDISQILLYKRIGHHLNFMAAAGLTAIAAKLGFFMFHIGIIGLENSRLHRIINVLFLSSCMSSIVLLLKFHILWQDSPIFTPYLHILCVSTLIYAFFGSLLSGNLKSKIIYFYMMFAAVFVELLHFHGFVWTMDFTNLLAATFLLFNALYLVYFYSGRKSKLLQNMQTVQINTLSLYSSLLVLTASVMAVTAALTLLYNRVNRYYIWCFAVLFVMSLSAFMRQIFNSPEHKVKNAPVLRGRPLFFGVLVLSLYGFMDFSAFRYAAPWVFAVIFLVLCRFNPIYKVYGFYDKPWQNFDWLGYLYKHLLIKPLQICGRILWIAIDRMLVEKTVLRIINAAAVFFLNNFRYVHHNAPIGISVAVIFLLALLWFSFLKGTG